VETEREENGRAGGEHSAPRRPFLCSALEANRSAQPPGSTLPPPGGRKWRPAHPGSALRERRLGEGAAAPLSGEREREGESTGGRREGAAVLCRSEKERVRESICEKVNGKPNSSIYMKKDIGPRLGLLGLGLFRGGHYRAAASKNRFTDAGTLK
jgi:hypothetical protein